MKKISFKSTAGFTLIEIGIIVPILILTILVLFDALFAMIQSSNMERTKINMSYDRQIAITNIESDVVLSSTFLPVLDPSSMNDVYKPTTNGNKWSYLGSGASKRVLILKTYSTTKNPLDSSRRPVFIGNPLDELCNATNIYFNDVLQYNVIFFVENNNLYRRRIVDAATQTCEPQYQKQSCPSVVDLGAAQHSSCKADDELLARDVSNFTVAYYASKSDTAPIDVYATGADPNLVTTAVDAEISVTITKKTSGKTMTDTSKLRLSKLNTKLKTN